MKLSETKVDILKNVESARARKVEVGDKVRIQSKNDLLHAYEKARTPFIVSRVVDEYITLKFAEDGMKFDCVMFDYEVLPYIS